jgi:RNA polymerase sigma-70 factor (ECF subfamily)
MAVTASDAELVSRCRAGDERAWSELVERFARYIHAICSQGFRLAAHDSEDVFQEVFARAYEHLDRLRSDEAIRTWLAQLTGRSQSTASRRGARARRRHEADPGWRRQTLARLGRAADRQAGLDAVGDPCQRAPRPVLPATRALPRRRGARSPASDDREPDDSCASPLPGPAPREE